jgi:hypothetical protein
MYVQYHLVFILQGSTNQGRSDDSYGLLLDKCTTDWNSNLLLQAQYERHPLPAQIHLFNPFL